MPEEQRTAVIQTLCAIAALGARIDAHVDELVRTLD
jgi:hypothetical protein